MCVHDSELPGINPCVKCKEKGIACVYKEGKTVACTVCKKEKKKCVYEPGQTTCKNCTLFGHVCTPSVAKNKIKKNKTSDNDDVAASLTNAAFLPLPPGLTNATGLTNAASLPLPTGLANAAGLPLAVPAPTRANGALPAAAGGVKAEAPLTPTKPTKPTEPSAEEQEEEVEAFESVMPDILNAFGALSWTGEVGEVGEVADTSPRSVVADSAELEGAIPVAVDVLSAKDAGAPTTAPSARPGTPPADLKWVPAANDAEEPGYSIDELLAGACGACDAGDEASPTSPSTRLSTLSSTRPALRPMGHDGPSHGLALAVGTEA